MSFILSNFLKTLFHCSYIFR